MNGQEKLNGRQVPEGHDSVRGDQSDSQVLEKEEAVRLWLTDWAAAAEFDHQTDRAGNLVVRVPSSAGRESSPTVVLQGHMDMVCEKTPGSTHDFSRDPLRLVYEGEWVRADQTTLGADNGIALAIAMAVSEDGQVDRPPLELLFTVDEESGLSGADHLDPDLIRGRILLNLDSEDEGVFTIGCAGGEELLIDLAVDREDGIAGSDGFEIRVGGLRGGHSGIDIQKHRENANCILARVLAKALAIDGVRLLSIDGGSAHNAIPRDAAATMLCRETPLNCLSGRSPGSTRGSDPNPEDVRPASASLLILSKTVRAPAGHFFPSLQSGS